MSTHVYQIGRQQLNERLSLTVGHLFDNVPLVRGEEKYRARFPAIEVSILMATDGCSIANAFNAKHICSNKSQIHLSNLDQAVVTKPSVFIFRINCAHHSRRLPQVNMNDQANASAHVPVLV